MNRSAWPQRRSVSAIVVLALLLAQASCTSLLPPVQSRFTVGGGCNGRVHCYATIQAALDAADTVAPGEWLQIDIGPGHYREKVTLRRPWTRLHGAGAERSVLQYDAVAETAGKYHRDGWGTAGSATLTIDADQVVVEGLTVENTFDYLTNDAFADSDPRKIVNSQALAVLLDIHSDRVLFEDATLLGFQDTLFARGGRALFRHGVIAGNVDFIFGNGQLLVADSTIRTRPRSAAQKADDVRYIIAAPSTPLNQASGIVIYRSRLTREPGVPDGAVALARPWHPTRSFPDGRYADPEAVGQVSFIDCHMDAHIHPDHWTSMLGTARDGSKTQVFRAQDARFFESGSFGAGARHSDLGLHWSSALTVAEVVRAMSRDWPEARRAL